MRTQRYRNARIISVLKDLYHTGGDASFVQRFNDQFPMHAGPDGSTIREAPIAMVALVATGVSPIFPF
jgi:hypothetical protein